MPAGELVTVPLPVTNTDIVGFGTKIALTDSAAFIATMQLPKPLQAPLQVLKLQPLAGAAVNVTCDPPVNVPLHVDGQLMPVGLLVTVPLPVMLTVRLAL